MNFLSSVPIRVWKYFFFWESCIKFCKVLFCSTGNRISAIWNGQVKPALCLIFHIMQSSPRKLNWKYSKADFLQQHWGNFNHWLQRLLDQILHFHYSDSDANCVTWNFIRTLSCDVLKYLIKFSINHYLNVGPPAAEIYLINN